MAQRRHHYERAFEEYLRARRIPYVAVDEARKALLPEGAAFRHAGESLKSFDFVVYGDGLNLLVDIKGRKVIRRRTASPTSAGRLETWVTSEDVGSLQLWQGLFGSQFQAAFVFVYWCDEQPPDALFDEVFEFRGRWYVLRAVRLTDYIANMRTRSVRWKTVHVPTAQFERISQPLAEAPDRVLTVGQSAPGVGDVEGADPAS
ncbi:MAG TPA: HYExAFE family protein [Phycisphaerales bacterium]|nr:HYExAFE family protein [Phycisphaerales bacterium]